MKNINSNISFHSHPDTDTDGRSNIFNHKNGLLGGNSYIGPQYANKFQRDPYMMQPVNEESMYREQPQNVKNDWPQMPQQQQIPIQTQKQQNAIWPEKLPKQLSSDDGKLTDRKKLPKEYSDEEYSESDDSQVEGDDVTTTEAPKKVIFSFL